VARTDNGEFQIALYMPDGRSLDALGSLTGVMARGTARNRLLASRFKTQSIQAVRMKAQVASPVRIYQPAPRPSITGTTAKTPIAPNVMRAVSVSPTTLTSGQSARGTVTLAQPAAGRGATVTLASDSKSVRVPLQVVVPGGRRSASFSIKTGPVSEVSGVKIRASFGGSTRAVGLTIKPVPEPEPEPDPQPESAGSPDLAIRPMSVSPQVAVAGEDVVTITCELQNVGSATLMIPGGTRLVSRRVDGIFWNTAAVDPATLNPGDTLPCGSWFPVSSVPAGTYSYEVIIDPNNVLAETDESNNTASIDFGVRVVTDVDLVISSITTTPTELTTMTPFQVTAIVKNEGTDTAEFGGQGSNISVVSDTYPCTFAGTLHAYLSIEGGATRAFTFDAAPHMLAPGSHSCTYSINTPVVESDKTNNSTTLNWTIAE